MLTRAGETSNLGWVHVNNDSTNLYLGIKSPMFYASQNIHLQERRDMRQDARQQRTDAWFDRVMH
jgi:hypothetical protein